MKKLIYCFAVFTLALSLTTLAEAASSVSVGATAGVTNELNITASVFQVDSKGTDVYTDDTWNPTPVSSMAFGSLKHILIDGKEAGTMYATPYYFVALLGGFSSGRPYTIQEQCDGLVSGSTTITGGLGVTYIDGNPLNADHTPINSGTMTGTLGSLGPAIGAARILYDSGTPGAARTIHAYFGIPSYKADGSVPYPGFVPIKVDTPQGTYSGNVIFSIALK